MPMTAASSVAANSEPKAAASRTVASAPAKEIAKSRPVKPAVAPPAASAKGKPQAQYAVNVGLFADENNARNAVTKLRDAGLPVVRQQVRGPKGRRERIRVGPYETRTEADAAAERIRTLGLEAIVIQP